MDKPRLLVIEDDLQVVRGLVRGLSRAGFDVAVAMDGQQGVDLALGERFALIVLDLMLPERSGFEVLEALHGRTSTPVLVLSARTELDARLRSFGGGAIDFVPKPFFIEELVARIRSRLAIVEPASRRLLRCGDLEVDLDAREARLGAELLELTAHEFNVLAYLMERTGRALTRTQIADHALPESGERSERTVDSHLSRIRKKLGPDAGARIKTVWGIGYRFDLGE